MNATANLPGTFLYSPAAGTVLKAATQTLSVVFTPTDPKTYSSGTATVQLSVAQASPTISWPAPAAIVHIVQIVGGFALLFINSAHVVLSTPAELWGPYQG